MTEMTDLIKMADETAALFPRDKARSDPASGEAFSRFDAAANDFLGVLCEVPVSPDQDTVKSQLNLVFNGKDGDAREDIEARYTDAEFIASLLPEVHAVMAVRYLLAYRRAYIDPTNASNWDRFSTRFQDAILQA